MSTATLYYQFYSFRPISITSADKYDFIAFMLLVMFIFSYSMVVGLSIYTLLLRQPHRKNKYLAAINRNNADTNQFLYAEKLGLIEFLFQQAYGFIRCVRCCVVLLDQKFFTSLLVNCDQKKLVIISRERSPFIVSLKKYGPKIPPAHLRTKH